MKKGVILFDLDRTIFDTDNFSQTLVLKLQRVMGSTSLEKVQKAKQEFVSSLKADREFDPEKFTDFLCDKFNFKNKKAILSVFYDDKKLYSDSIFPEAVEILKILKNRYVLGVYSEGTKIFQNYKFNSTQMSYLFDKNLVFILDHKTNPRAILKIPKDSIVIDDKESICEYLSKNHIKTIWLNKKDNRTNSDFQTVHNLLELPGILL